jgi:hypothetical protein
MIWPDPASFEKRGPSRRKEKDRQFVVENSPTDYYDPQWGNQPLNKISDMTVQRKYKKRTR